jgi:hypothetical protein
MVRPGSGSPDPLLSHDGKGNLGASFPSMGGVGGGFSLACTQSAATLFPDAAGSVDFIKETTNA